MIRSISSFLALLLSSLSLHAYSAAQCPAINCDCESLSNAKWVEVCKAHEARIKKACVANANTPKDYCAVHGLNAKPLPLAIELSEYKLDTSVQPAQLNEKIAALYWAMHADTQKAKESLAKENYPRVMQILQLVDENIDNLFSLQQQVDAFHRGQSDDKSRSAAWKDYSSDTEKYAGVLEALGHELAATMDKVSGDKLKKIHSVLAQKSLRMAGKGYEHAGYAYGQSGRHDKAAKVWRTGSDVAVALSRLEKADGAKPTAVKFTEYMAAARLHRASYHALQDKNVDASLEGLKASQQFVDREVQQNIEALVSTGADAGAGVLTGR